jgi:hypothetical protein
MISEAKPAGAKAPTALGESRGEHRSEDSKRDSPGQTDSSSMIQAGLPLEPATAPLITDANAPALIYSTVEANMMLGNRSGVAAILL